MTMTRRADSLFSSRLCMKHSDIDTFCKAAPVLRKRSAKRGRHVTGRSEGYVQKTKAEGGVYSVERAHQHGVVLPGRAPFV